MKLVAILFSLVLQTQVVAAAEPAYVDPAIDTDLLANFEGIYSPGNPAPTGRFNLLIIGQDDGGRSKLKDGRPRLSSRADIIMVLSTDLTTKKMTILSIYRDLKPTKACTDRIGRSAPDNKINGVYSVGGRKMFIPCLEGMMEELIEAAGLNAEYLDANGRFFINAFFEGTRSRTIRPVAESAAQILWDNWGEFVWIYGLNSLGAAADVVMNGSSFQRNLNAETPPEIAPEDLNVDYLSIELKERYAYKAGGFQRSFNFAYMIAGLMGWSAYGIENSDNYDFLGRLFGATINDNFSRSVDFVELEKSFLNVSGDHLFRHACFRDNVSPIKIIQWGEDESAYSIFENGEFRTSKNLTLLKFLKVVPILPAPPSC